MSFHLTEQAMIAYADERARLGRRLLAQHVPESTGCCRACGRIHPCPDRRYGGELLVHFDHWWSDHINHPYGQSGRTSQPVGEPGERERIPVIDSAMPSVEEFKMDPLVGDSDPT